MSQVTFKGSPAAQLIAKLPTAQRWGGNLLMLKEGVNGRGIFTCVQDTAVALLPKAMTSRSKVEASEVGFLEILESALIYFTAPKIGGPVFNKIFSSFLPKGVTAGLLTKPVDQLTKDQLRYVLPAKAGVILNALALTGIGGEYIINYARNLMTAEVFHKDQFSDVVGLSKGEIKSGERSSVVEKSWKRIYQVLGTCLGIGGLSLMGAKFAPKIMSEGFIEGPLKSIVKFLDFRFSEKGGYGLSKGQMGTYMALSVPAYLDSARDNLERWESVTRLGLVLPYLLWGQDWLEGLIREKFPAISRPTGNGANRVLSLEEVLVESYNKTSNGQHLPPIEDLSSLTEEKLQKFLSRKDVAETFKTAIRQKSFHVGIPLAVGILGTGFGINFLNRYWTKYRFEEQQRAQQQGKNSVFIAPPLGNNILPMPPGPTPEMTVMVPPGFYGYGQPAGMMPIKSQASPTPFTTPAFSNHKPLMNRQPTGYMAGPQPFPYQRPPSVQYVNRQG